ncbi:PaaI family thioesterase [Hasllibacter sp. MH4015]|uniref:PaaI family thioesterase n=1 Tax=Hasllibacter sp. MH4015 TaxID=2854029 RepID=UPI001CD200BA|nr:PaaI family thioesterase [Hasllibacter sp. MH4015]
MTPAKAAIEASFAKQGLMRSFKAGIEEIASGRVVLSMPISPAIGQQHGVAHAGASFALGDSASGYAALTLMEPGAEVMTVEMKINLIAPAAGRRLIATGEVVKPGRRLMITRCTVQAEAEDGILRDVALLQGTMIPV